MKDESRNFSSAIIKPLLLPSRGCLLEGCGSCPGRNISAMTTVSRSCIINDSAPRRPSKTTTYAAKAKAISRHVGRAGEKPTGFYGQAAMKAGRRGNVENRYSTQASRCQTRKVLTSASEQSDATSTRSSSGRYQLTSGLQLQTPEPTTAQKRPPHPPDNDG